MCSSARDPDSRRITATISLLANNAQWIGFSVEIGPDGDLYVLDWHDGDICGQGITHKETGRIFRIAPAQSLAKDWDGRYGDLKALSDAELVSCRRAPATGTRAAPA